MRRITKSCKPYGHFPPVRDPNIHRYGQNDDEEYDPAEERKKSKEDQELGQGPEEGA